MKSRSESNLDDGLQMSRGQPFEQLMRLTTRQEGHELGSAQGRATQFNRCRLIPGSLTKRGANAERCTALDLSSVRQTGPIGDIKIEPSADKLPA